MIKNRNIYYALVVVLAFGLIVLLVAIATYTMAGNMALFGNKKVDTTESKALLGKWRLKNLDILNTNDVDIFIEFLDDGMIGGVACNNYGGAFNVSSGALTISDLYSTDKACEGQFATLEPLYFNALQTSREYIVNENVLTIRYGSAENILEYTKFTN